MFCEMVRTIFQSLTADVFQSHGKTLAWAAQKRCYMIILGIRVSWECRFQASGQRAVLVVGMDPCRPGHRIAHGDAVHNFFSHPGTWSWSGPTPLVTRAAWSQHFGACRGQGCFRLGQQASHCQLQLVPGLVRSNWRSHIAIVF